MQVKTQKQVMALQDKMQKFSDKLNKEVVAISKSVQHIQVKAGTVYQLNTKDFDTKKVNLIAKKIGDDLEVTLEEGVIIFDNYFDICATDLSCLVSLPAENGGLYHIVADIFFTLEDGTQVVYFYNEQSIVSTESSVINTEGSQSFEDIIYSNIEIVAAASVAVIVIASSGGGGGGGSSSNNDFFVTLMAGPVLDNTGIKIAAYDKDGKLIAEGEKQADGRYKFDKSKITGIVIFKAYDTNNAVDYQDEKGNKMDLDIALLAVTNTEGKSVAAITVLTTIAAKQAGITDDGKAEAGGVTVSSTPLTETIVNAKNEGVGNAFGVNDISSIPKAMIDKDGKATHSADNYGQVLAAVSGVSMVKDVVEKYDTMSEWDTATQNDGTFKDVVKQEFVNGAAKVAASNDEIDEVPLNAVLTGNGSITAQVLVTITSNKTGIATDDIIFTFTFDQALTHLSDFAISDIRVTGGIAANSFKSGSTTTIYQLIVTPDANTEGDIIISVDAKLSKYASAINFIQAYDVKAPSAPENLVLATNDDTGLSDSDNITNKTAVTIVGEAEAGSTVELFNGDISLGEKITVDNNGNFSKTIILAANVTTNITAKATDAVGNTSPVSDALSVSVDTIVPTFTSGSTGVGVINQINPVYNAEVDGGDASVKYTLRAADLLKFNIDADSGIVTYKTALTAATLTADNIVITATDIAGNTSIRNVAITVVDQPLVVIASNKPNGTNGAFELTFTFTEKVNGFELSDIVFTGAGTNDVNISKGTLTTASSGANQNKVFTLMVTPETTLTDGDITVDVAANAATSATSNKTNIAATQFIQKFDETKPATPNAILTDSGSNATDNTTNDATISAPTNTETNATVEYKINEGAWRETYTKPTTDGAYAVKVRQTDGAGNISDEQTFFFTLDTSVAILTAALETDTGGSNSDNLTKDATVNITNLETGATWEYSKDNGTNWTTGTGTSFELAENTVYAENAIQVRQTDKAGNVSDITQMAAITIDNIAPIINTASINSGTTLLVLTLSKGVIGTPDKGDFVVKNGATDSLTDNIVTAVTVSGNTITLTLTTAVDQRDGVTIAYTQNTDANKQLKGSAGNSVVSDLLTTTTVVDISAPIVTGAVNPSATEVIKAGDTLSIELTLSEEATLANGEIATIVLLIDKIDSSGVMEVIATATGNGSSSNKLTFTTLALPNGLADSDGVEIKASSLVFLATVFKDASGNDVSKIFSKVNAVSNEQVDSVAPTFNSAVVVDVVVNTAIAVVIYDAQATDNGGVNDAGITYSIKDAANNKFDINATTGWLTYQEIQTTEHSDTVTIVAIDTAGNSNELVVTVRVKNFFTSIDWVGATADNYINSIEKAGATLSGTIVTVGDPVTIDSIQIVKNDNTTIDIEKANIISTGENWKLNSIAKAQIANLADGIYTAKVSLKDSNNQVVVLDSKQVTYDTIINLDINTVATNDIINFDKKNVGFDVTGSSDAIGQTVTVSWVGTEKTAIVQANGVWSVAYVAADITYNADSSVISATVNDAAGNEKTVEHTVHIDITSATLSINTVATNDEIDAVEKNAGIVINGKSDALGQTVTVSWGGNDKTAIVDDITGVWYVTYAAADVPADAISSIISAKVSDAIGNPETISTRTVLIDTMATEQPIITIKDGEDAYVNSIETGVNLQISAVGMAVGDEIQLKKSSDVSLGDAYIVTADDISNGKATIRIAKADLGSTGDVTEITATITDIMGYTSVPSSAISITLNTLIPSTLTITLTTDTGSSDGITQNGDMTISGVEEGNSWHYSTDSGSNWHIGGGSSFVLNVGTYAVDSIWVKQTDVAGNASSISKNSQAITVDTIAPTLTINIDDTNLTTGESTTLKFNFSEIPAVDSFDISDITASNGSISQLVVDSEDASRYTALFTPTENIDESTNVISVGTDWTDIAGNAPTAITNSVNYQINTNVDADTMVPNLQSPPVLTVTGGGNSIGDTIVLTFVFNEMVKGLETGTTNNIFTVQSTPVEATWSGSNNTATRSLTYTIAAGQNGTVIIDKAALKTALIAGITDTSNNAFDSTATIAGIDISALVSIDGTVPEISITHDVTETLKAGNVITYTFTFDNAVTGFDKDDIVVDNGTKGAFVKTGDTTYTLVVTPTANFTGNLNIEIAANAATDSAGNSSAAITSTPVIVNTIRPSVSISIGNTNLTSAENTTLSFNFSEAPAVNSFTSDDIIAPNGTITNLTVDSADAKHYTATFTAAQGVADDSNYISVGTNWTNIAGNAPEALTQSINYKITDTHAPTIVITDDVAGDIGIGANITYTFTFSEAVTGFDQADISVSNGTKGQFTKVSNAVYSLVVTQTGVDNITVNVATGAAKDGANIDSIAAQSVQTADLQRPTVAISMNNTDFLRTGNTATISFNFSEIVKDFDLSDITTDKGTITNLVVDSTDASLYTATYTATQNIESKYIDFTITATGWTDMAGNTPEAVVQVSVTSSFQSPPILAIQQGEDRYLNATEATIGIEVTLQQDAQVGDSVQFKTKSGAVGELYVIQQSDIDNKKFSQLINRVDLGENGTEAEITAVIKDQLGNTSHDSNALLIIIDEASPLLLSSSWHINTPPIGQNSFIVDDIIELSVTTSEPLKFGDTTGSQLIMGGKIFVLDVAKSSENSNKKLVFTHQVSVDETMAQQEAIIKTDQITLNGVTDMVGNALALPSLVIATSLYQNAIFHQSTTNPFTNIDTSTNTNANATPTFADIDQDGDLDLIIGSAAGTLSYYTNVNNNFVKATDSPFQHIRHTSAAPTFVDLDQDGNLDLIVGDLEGKLHFYKNIQYGNTATFNLVAAQFNPLSDIDIGSNATPTFADIDQDGDLDLIVGSATGTLTYYQSNNNNFTETSNNPFQNISHAYSTPTFVDVDQDGDLDLVVGYVNGALHYYQNNDTVFSVKTTSNALFSSIKVGNNAAPTFADIDNNGTLDLILGAQDGSLQYQQRQQSEVIDAQAPSLSIVVTQTTLLKGQSSQIILNFSEAVKGFTLDNLSAENATLSNLKLNPNRHSTQPFSYLATLTPNDNINQASNRISVNSNWQDLNGNTPASNFSSNIYQVFTDTNSTQIQGWTSNTPSSTQIAFTQGDTITISLSLSANAKVNNSQAYIVIDEKRFDIDKDDFNAASDKTVLNFNYTVQANDTLNLPDFVVKRDQVFLNGVTDTYDYNLDLSSMPEQVLLGERALFKLESSLDITQPKDDRINNAFYADVNADGYMDVISTDAYNHDGGGNYASLSFYFFQGSATGLTFREGAGTPFYQWDKGGQIDAEAGGSLRTAAFADVDNDGDLDMLVTQRKLSYNIIKFFDNQDGIYIMQGSHSLANISATSLIIPTFADIDGDGDADLVVGDSEGTLKYYTNQQSVFTQQTGVNNPFTMDVGTHAAPTFADIDNDGDLDLLIGSSSGWHYYQNINGVWIAQTGVNNPFSGVAGGIPNFVDVDFDGNKDLAITALKHTYYYRNTHRTVIDTQAPETPSINIHDISLSAGDSTKVEFHFAEKVLNFTLDDITAENATLSNFRQDTSLGTFVWTATLAPDSGVNDSTNTLSIGRDWHDSAGNKPSQITTSSNYMVSSQVAANISSNVSDWVFSSPPTGQDYFSIGDTMTLTISMSKAVQVTDGSAYLMLANRRFNIDKAAFDLASDKTKLNFTYTVVEGDYLISSDFVVNSTHLTGVSDVAGVAANDLSAELVLLRNSDTFERSHASIPGIEKGTFSTVNFIDLNNDGAEELVIGLDLDSGSDRSLYYKITPDGGSNSFVKITGNADPFREIDFAGDAILAWAFADINRDGYLDFLTSKGYYIYSGDKFLLQTGVNDPFSHLDLSKNQMHNLVDLDNDGDFDLVAAEDNGTLSYYENNNGVYALKTDHVLSGIDLGSGIEMNFRDLDGDGDLDLTSGSFYGTNNREAISYRENVGTINNPIFSHQRGDSNFFDHLDNKGLYIGSPGFSDINGDGILDFVTAQYSNYVQYYKGVTNPLKVKTVHYQDMDGITSIAASDKLIEHFHWNRLSADKKYVSLKDATITNFDLSHDTLDVSALLLHLENDNAKQGHINIQINGEDSVLSIDNFDITLIGVNASVETLIENKVLRISSDKTDTINTNPFANIDTNTNANATPTFADIDQDGDLDLIIGSAAGTLSYYTNVNNNFVKATDSPFQHIRHTSAAPTFVDLDQDGNLDLIVGDLEGKLHFYKNIQYGNTATFNLVAAQFNPLSDIDIGSNATPTFADIDQDGDLDLIVGSATGTLTYYQSNNNNFTETSNNPFQNISHAYSTPTFVDVDQDGDLDLVVGYVNGALHYYQNNDTVFSVKTTSNALFSSIKVGNNAAPTFADIDNNGTLDLILGAQDGSLQYQQRQQSEVIDAQAPSLSIVVTQTTLLKGQSSQIILNFSEAVKGFTLDNLSAENATLSNLKLNPNRHSTQPFSYLATLTPNDNINQASNRISVNSNWQDLNGNTPASNFSSNIYQVFTDTNSTQIQGWTSNTPSSTQIAFTQGDTITISLSLSANAKVNNSQAYIVIDEKRFDIDKDDFNAASDKTVLNFNYTVQANDTLNLPDFVVKRDQVFLNGVTDTYDYNLDLSSMPEQVLLGERALFKLESSLDITQPKDDRINNAFYADVNADGYMDVISTDAYNHDGGGNYASLSFYFFQGSATGLTFREGAGTPFYQWDKGGQIDAEAGGSLRTAAFADVDNDGDLDMLVTQRKLSYNIIKFFDNQDGIYIMQGSHSLANISATSLIIPTFADIDGDGDADLVVGDSEGTLKYYTNQQSVFTQQTGVNNPFTMDVGTHAAPTFADIDNDGDLDLLIGSSSGWHYYQNINGVWIAQTGVNNPFSGVAGGIPNFVDVDFDGNKDLAITALKHTYYYRNTHRTVIDTQAPETPSINIHDISLSAGDSTKVEFHFAEKVLNFTLDDITAENATLSNFRQDTSLGTFVWTATLAPDSGVNDSTNTLSIGRDWHDSAGNKPSQITTSSNYMVSSQVAANISSNVSDWVFSSPPTGQDYFSIGDTMTLTISMSKAVQVTDGSAYLMLANRRFNIDKAAFDLASDKTKLNFTYTVVEGDYLISSDFVVNSTHLTGVSDVAGVAANDLSAELVLLRNSDTFERSHASIPGIEKGTFSTVNFIDLNNDGAEELVIGLDLDSGSDRSLYYKITPDGGSNSFVKITGNADPFREIDFAGDAILAWAFADINRDGYLDFLTSKGYYIYSGDKFLLQTGVNDPFSHLDLSKNQMHNLVDLDNDGDFDLVAAEDNGTLSYYENNNGVYALKTDHVLSGIDLGSGIEMNFRDLDGDGDLDLTSGSFYGTNNREAISYRENVGTINNPIFSHQRGDSNFFDHLDNKGLYIGSPGFSDINGDGILDFVTAQYSNYVQYYKGVTNPLKVKTVHYQDMDGITSIAASDKLIEHFHWNRLSADKKYVSLKDATITNFDLSHDTLDVSALLLHLENDNAKQGHINIQINGEDSVLSIDNFDITLIGVNDINYNMLIDNGIVII
ncbi:hypothetical protein MS2017_0743 [Bathymodiolus thermophilus thioautotrophic gill symbiont]|uniref:Bacterial Ig-like domain-containing protein n=1 Tax=Bathymodiolus thermophilus thioautotrophic gill symbiont TaxID=2360 RepID=A0A3G3IL20_9GAMM|nr:Ig-like domain-containing protein [Bathymodiolus thermophilus thioautotrophic gill symbiont]AYQ56471.1 hypothetical protein MS2017_0743 [Bathymodiolus thermophilus thioautotrophic gill symbiont]